jgi:hypothetical protein
MSLCLRFSILILITDSQVRNDRETNKNAAFEEIFNMIAAIKDFSLITQRQHFM